MTHFGEFHISTLNCSHLRIPLCSKQKRMKNKWTVFSGLIRSLIPSVKSPDCPPFYEHIGDSCFMHFPLEKVFNPPFEDSIISFQSILKVSWSESQNFCSRTGGLLASIENEKFFNFMEFVKWKNLSSEHLWLGGRFQNSLWKWTDGIKIKDQEFFWTLT